MTKQRFGKLRVDYAGEIPKVNYIQVGYSPWGREESNTIERLQLSLSCIGEGNGNPLQCSCLENPRDGGAWWAAVLWGLTESDTTEVTQQQQQQACHIQTAGRNNKRILWTETRRENHFTGARIRIIPNFFSETMQVTRG